MAASVSQEADGAPHVGLPEPIATLPEVFDYGVGAAPREFIVLQRLAGSGLQSRIQIVVNFLDDARRSTSEAASGAGSYWRPRGVWGRSPLAPIDLGDPNRA